MARTQRIEYEGAVYHVTARGNERREIFRDDADREHFLGRGVAPTHFTFNSESDASVRLQGRSHVPGRRRGRAQAVEAGTRNAKPPVETPSVGIRLWAVFKKGSGGNWGNWGTA